VGPDTVQDTVLAPSAFCQHLNITNVLPAPSSQTSHLVSMAGTPVPDMPSRSTPTDRLNIPGFRDDAVKEYCN
jgi:hypothetical protein